MKVFYTSTILLATVLLSACTLFPGSKPQPTPTPVPVSVSTPAASISATPTSKVTNPVVSLKTKDGQILIRLFADVAPKTVANFLTKVNAGFYNGLTFHRVIADFMAQGGDPTGTGNGGNRQVSELNQTPFVRGSLGLARTAETKDYSNDSQFFICFTTNGCQHLTGDYVNFGQVISGLEVLDQIKQGDKIVQITANTK